MKPEKSLFIFFVKFTKDLNFPLFLSLLPYCFKFFSWYVVNTIAVTQFRENAMSENALTLLRWAFSGLLRDERGGGGRG